MNENIQPGLIPGQTPTDRNNKPSMRACIGCFLLVIAVFGAITSFIYFQFHPRNRIEIEVKNIPPDTRFLCIVAETQDGTIAMNWSPCMIMPFEMTPQKCSWSFPLQPEASMANRHVMWKFGRRYGVVTRRSGKSWLVHWFRAEDLPLTGRTFLLGAGVVAFDLQNAETEQLPADLVRKLGFEDVNWADEK